MLASGMKLCDGWLKRNFRVWISHPNRFQIALKSHQARALGGHLAEKDLTSPVVMTFTSPVFVLRSSQASSEVFPRRRHNVALVGPSPRRAVNPSLVAVGVSGIRQCHPKSGSPCGFLKHLHIPTWHKITNSVLCEPSSQSHLTRRRKHAARM